MPMLWELLVTDGHVRAARLRYLAPYGIVAAIVLLAAGWLLLNELPPSQQFYFSSESLLQKRAAQVRQPVLVAFSRVPVPYMPSTELQQLVPEDNLSGLQKAISKSLEKETVPGSSVKEVGSAEFWSWNWPKDGMIYLNKGDVRAFGVIASSTEDPNHSHPVRWLAIFRKFPSGWDNVAVKANGFVTPPGEKIVTPGDISLSLRKLMDLPEVEQ